MDPSNRDAEPPDNGPEDTSLFVEEDFPDDPDHPYVAPPELRELILSNQEVLKQRLKQQHPSPATTVEDQQVFDPELNPDEFEGNIARMRAEAEIKRRERKRQSDERAAALSETENENEIDIGIDIETFSDDDKEDLPEPPPAKTTKKRARQKGDGPPTKKARVRKGRKPDSPKSINVRDMLAANVFADAHATADLPAQPKLSVARTRAEALARLMLSIPQEDRRAARSDKILLDNAIRDIDGAKSIKFSSEDGYLLDGMKTPLKNYQLIALAFMRKRERSEEQPRGGILADAMGLGKTLEVLANIINGQQREKGKPRATLIVVPAGVLRQWQDEIKKHVYTGDEVSKRRDLFAGNDAQRMSAKHGLREVVDFREVKRFNNVGMLLTKQDVVLTTYSMVSRSHPRLKPPPELHTARQKNDWYRQHLDEHAGVLHKTRWLRVVLDEAHCIKNHLSNTSLACRALLADHYWAVSGTPVQNSISEFYSYFRLIRDPYVQSFRQFNTNFCSPDDPDGIKRLQAMLSKVMIRRTHADKMLGAKLLDIPEPEKPATLVLHFNATEKQLYDLIKRKYVDKVNKLSRNGGLTSHYNYIYTLLVRLRQATSHVLLLHDALADVLDRADFERLNHDLVISGMPTEERAYETMLQLNEMLCQVAEQRADTTEGDVLAIQGRSSFDDLRVSLGEAASNLGFSHGNSGTQLKRYIKDLGSGDALAKMRERTTCSDCCSEPVDPHITSCYHIYCKMCMESLQVRAARLGDDNAKCLICGEAFNSVSKCVEYEDTNTVGIPATANTVLPNHKAANTGINRWISMPGPIAPSTKTIAMKMQVLQWLEKDPNVKIIIYSQFRGLIEILSKVCQMERWSYKRYTGDMSHEARNRAVQAFGDPEEKISILLASLKCGSLGLNLTAASRVLIMDSWWNDSVEQQAFCRVFRHGQTQRTELTRLVVQGTIDQDMMNIKNRKLGELNPVLEGEERKDKPSLQELLRLFGKVGKDDAGNEFIFPDEADYDNDDHLRLVDYDSQDEFREMGEEP